MAQYQTFPDASGDSATLDKLKALRLPPLTGKRFLDVGCNEGFFCGYASFSGASGSVGIDQSASFIDRARERFPGCEFFCQSWDVLPEGPFDVILLASALHYAEDQPALIRRLVDQLAPGGTLVLELGVSSAERSEWVKVKRGIDERYFPTWQKLHEILQDCAWKHVGPSVSQQGDPVRRHVLHITRRRPIAYLLMQPPAYGKSSISRGLFATAGVKVVSGDVLISQLANAQLKADELLTRMVAVDFSPVRIDQTVKTIFRAGLAPQLVELWIEQAGTHDFALDAYVPVEHHALVERLLTDRGYMPVTLKWERVGAPPPSVKETHELADAYYQSLARQFGQPDEARDQPPLPFAGTAGFIDDLELSAGQLTVRGWAVHRSGQMPLLLAVSVQGRRHLIESYERQRRPDVQKHLGLSHPICGYSFTIPLLNVRTSTELDARVEVFGGNAEDTLSGPFQLAAPAARKLGQK
ncbi:MAG TPA: class I SAM-dependent methyltransferase [Gammaproteobacteria bacterium]|nr:class I SAM-dependent methyltransferase [Gammaproteobacteria bacterium]